MKKKVFAIMLLSLFIGVLVACGGEEEEEEVETSTIQFFNSEGWDSVYATAQNRDGDELLGEFPGTEATPVDGADNFYEVEVEVESFLEDPVTIAFNNGDDEEGEANRVNHPDFIYVTIGEGVFGTRSDAEFAMREVEDTRVYFYNGHNWEDLNVYAFNGTEYFGGWPGSAEAVNEHDHEGWYYVDVAEDVDSEEIGFIINGVDEDGEDVQTNDILINDRDLVYTHPDIPDEEHAFDSFEAAEDDFYALAAQTEVYFYNDAVADTDFEGWDNVYVNVETHEGDLILENEPTEADNAWVTAVIPFSFADHGDDAYIEVTFHDGDGNEAYPQTIEDEDAVYVTYNDLYESQAEAERVSSGVTVVHFYNDEEWDNVYATATNGELDFTDVEADHDEGNWYTVEVPMVVFMDDEDASFDIYFHDGDGEESTTLHVFGADAHHILSTERPWNEREVAERFMDADEDEFLTFYFHNYYGWEHINAYIWNDTVEPDEYLGGWSGLAMEHYEDDWYKIDIPIDLADEDVELPVLIFNGYLNGEMEQTDDISVTDDSELYFTVTGGMYDNPEDAEDGVEADLAGTRVHFYNSYEWDNVHATVEHDELDETFEMPATEEEDGWFSVEVPLVYEEDFSDSFDITFHDDDENQHDATIIRDEYIFVTLTDTYRDQTWAQSIQDTDEEDLKTIYFYNSEEWDEVNVHMWGHDAYGDWPGVHMNEYEGNWMSVDVPFDESTDIDEYGIIFNEQVSEDGVQTVNGALTSTDSVYFVLTGEMDDDQFELEAYESQNDAEAALD